MNSYNYNFNAKIKYLKTCREGFIISHAAILWGKSGTTYSRVHSIKVKGAQNALINRIHILILWYYLSYNTQSGGFAPFNIILLIPTNAIPKSVLWLSI